MAERYEAPILPDWLADQVPFQRYTVEVEDTLRVHIMEQGNGIPVVMFHGNPTWGYLYRKVAEGLLDEPIRVIMPDLIGLGFSDRPYSIDDHSLENHSRWMNKALDAIGVDDAVAVVQDWGGAIGVHSLAVDSDRLRGLVVLNTILGPPKPGFTPTTFHKIMHSPLGSVVTALGYPHRRLSFAQGDKSSIKGVVQRSYNYPLSRANGGADAVLALGRMVPDSMDHPSIAPLGAVEEAVAAFNGPSAIVWGWKDPVLGKVLRRVNRQLPDAEVTETQAGHFLQEEVPVEIGAAIRSTVGRL